MVMMFVDAFFVYLPPISHRRDPENVRVLTCPYVCKDSKGKAVTVRSALVKAGARSGCSRTIVEADAVPDRVKRRMAGPRGVGTWIFNIRSVGRFAARLLGHGVVIPPRGTVWCMAVVVWLYGCGYAWVWVCGVCGGGSTSAWGPRPPPRRPSPAPAGRRPPSAS